MVCGLWANPAVDSGWLPLSWCRATSSGLLCGLFSRGECVAAYDKIHLFDVDVADAHGSYRESDAIEPGNLPVVAKLPDFGLD